jgi:hypothetical protein
MIDNSGLLVSGYQVSGVRDQQPVDRRKNFGNEVFIVSYKVRIRHAGPDPASRTY